MAITMKRQLNDEEKQVILKRHGRVCFATGHPITDNEKVHFDHIKAHSLGGPSELDNIAPMCEYHNKSKGMLPLDDYRIKLRLEDFFAEGDRLTLRHLLRDAVCAKLDIHDSDEKERPCYREISETDFTKIKAILERLFQWQMWKSPKNSEIDTVIAGNKSAIKEWFRGKGLTVGFLLGADI